MHRTAVIDLGSNSFRLVVFRYEPGGAWALWDEIREPVRLSAGMGEDRVLKHGPVARALDTVRTYVAFCEQTGIDDVVAVGTSALRDATNGPEVINAIQEAGLPVRILDGEEEAYYGALAILNTTTVTDGFGLDMGGGSVQLMRLRDAEMAAWVSWPLGAVRATEAFFADGEKSGVKALRKDVRKRIAQLDWLDAGAGPIAGIGGSVRNLAGAAQRLADLPNGGVQGFALTTEMVSGLVEELAGRSVEERRALHGINPDRGDVILAAAVVLETILLEGGFGGIEITEAGLREGMFFERYFDGSVPAVFDDVGRASVQNLMLRHGTDAVHSTRVAAHALAIYDGLVETKAIKKASDDDRRLLEAAALLHDIGRGVAYDNRHKHARYLILDEGLPGFARDDMFTIAQIVRYIPKGTPEADTRVELLAGVLRIAEQLERTRSSDVNGLAVKRNGGPASGSHASASGTSDDDSAVVILVDAGPNAQVGLWAAAHSTDLLSGALAHEVVVRAA